MPENICNIIEPRRFLCDLLTSPSLWAIPGQDLIFVPTTPSSKTFSNTFFLFFLHFFVPVFYMKITHKAYSIFIANLWLISTFIVLKCRSVRPKYWLAMLIWVQYCGCAKGETNGKCLWDWSKLWSYLLTRLQSSDCSTGLGQITSIQVPPIIPKFTQLWKQLTEQQPWAFGRKPKLNSPNASSNGRLYSPPTPKWIIEQNLHFNECMKPNNVHP